MSDSPPDTAPVDADTLPIGIDEWCAERSTSDPKVEVIAVFNFRERAAGRMFDTRANYLARYILVEATPVT